jgi:hypothetical protein
MKRGQVSLHTSHSLITLAEYIYFSTPSGNDRRKMALLYSLPLKYPNHVISQTASYILKTFTRSRINLDAITGTGENTTNSTRSITVNDTLHTSIRTRNQEEKPNDNNEDIQGQHEISIQGLFMEPVHTSIYPPHADVRYAPEDESKEGVKKGGHQG